MDAAAVFGYVEYLPDVAGVFADHFLAGLAVKCLLEIRAILQRTVYAVSARRVRVRLGQQARTFRRRILAPDLSKTKEEALIRRETIFFRSYLVSIGHGMMQSSQGDLQAAVVSCVLAECKAVIEMNVIHGNE